MDGDKDIKKDYLVGIDVEKQQHVLPQQHRLPPYASDEVVVPKEAFTQGNSTYAKIQRLAGRLKIEQRGIERVPEDERTDTSLVNVGTLVCNP